MQEDDFDVLAKSLVDESWDADKFKAELEKAEVWISSIKNGYKLTEFEEKFRSSSILALNFNADISRKLAIHFAAMAVKEMKDEDRIATFLRSFADSVDAVCNPIKTSDDGMVDLPSVWTQEYKVVYGAPDIRE